MPCEKFSSEIYDLFLQNLDPSDRLKCSHVSPEFWHLSRRITFRNIDFEDNLLSPKKPVRIEAIKDLLEDQVYSVLSLVESASLGFKIARRTTEAHPTGTKIINLLCSHPTLQKITISLDSGSKGGCQWSRFPNATQASLVNLIKLKSLRSVCIQNISGIPAEVFDGMHAEALTIEGCNLKADISSPAILHLSQLKELSADSSDMALLFLEAEATTQSLEKLKIVLNDGRMRDQKAIDFGYFHNLRSVEVHYNPPEGRHVWLHVQDDTNFASFCNTYLRPSKDCCMLEDLVVAFSIRLTQNVVSNTTRDQCHYLDVAIAHPAFSNATVQLLLTCYVDNGGQTTELSADAQIHILGLFPLLHQLGRSVNMKLMKLDVPLARLEGWVDGGDYDGDSGFMVVPGLLSLPLPNPLPFPADDPDDSYPDVPGLQSNSNSDEDSDDD